MNTRSTPNYSVTIQKIAVLAATFIAPLSQIESSRAQEVVVGASSELATIASREEELRRKEEELLRSMSNQVKPSEADSSISIPAIKVEPVSEPRPAQGSSEPGLATRQSAPSVDNDALKELENHPALEKQDAARPPSYPQQSNQIRTYSEGVAPDGTTANRLGKFTRINKNRASADDGSRRGSTPRIVPIQPVSREPYLRPASLTSDDQATVRTPSTSLKTGPTQLDSTVMQLPRDTELTIDYRSGSWYRVRTRQGLRGWVSSAALLFNSNVPGYSTVRIGGVRGNPR
jgi:hypothetical protein